MRTCVTDERWLDGRAEGRAPAANGRLIIDERRVYRTFALPVSAFDVLQDLKRAWKLETNAEVVTRLLYTAGPAMLTRDVTARHGLPGGN